MAPPWSCSSPSLCLHRTETHPFAVLPPPSTLSGRSSDWSECGRYVAAAVAGSPLAGAHAAALHFAGPVGRGHRRFPPAHGHDRAPLPTRSVVVGGAPGPARAGRHHHQPDRPAALAARRPLPALADLP